MDDSFIDLRGYEPGDIDIETKESHHDEDYATLETGSPSSVTSSFRTGSADTPGLPRVPAAGDTAATDDPGLQEDVVRA